MKNCYLTIDYELFLGDKTGSVLDCMINPTNKLMSILELNDSKMTVFWDVLHYKRLLDFVSEYPQLQFDIDLIHNQIIELIKKGHDVQLHLHPHWIDAVFNGLKWNFIYDHFSLQSLSDDIDINNIFGLKGCIFQAIEVMKTVIHPIYPNYRINKFRAGGYKIEPFERIASVFKEANINIDTSVCSEMHNIHPISFYDFRNYPKCSRYCFSDSPKVEDNGFFTEFPITTVKVSGIRNLYYKWLRKCKYPNLESNRCGVGIASSDVSKKSSSFLRKITKNLFHSKIEMFSTDSMFPEKFKFLLKHIQCDSVMILHPKLMNDINSSALEYHIKKHNIRFDVLPNS